MLLNPYRFAASSDGIAAKYWRINVTSAWASTYVGAGDMQLRATPGGADQCEGGVPSASGTFGAGYEAAGAFDASVTTYWLSNSTGSAKWLKYEFLAPVSVSELVIAAETGGGAGTTSGVVRSAPRDFTLEYSSDNINWTVKATFTGQSFTPSESKTFSV